MGVAKFDVTFEPGGKVIPKFDMKALQLWRNEFYTSILEILLSLMFIGYIADEMGEIIELKIKYLYDSWNVLDIMQYSMWIAMVIYRIMEATAKSPLTTKAQELFYDQNVDITGADGFID